jgi:hypothetical protein
MAARQATTSQVRAQTIRPGRVLAVHFDIVPTPWAGQPDTVDPNHVFLIFRGGVILSKNTVATATLFVDGVELGSTGVEDSCLVHCQSLIWEFASAPFPDVPLFPTPTIIDFTPLLNGSRGVMLLSVQSGSLTFRPPDGSNAPVVVFQNIESCGHNCTRFRSPITVDSAPDYQTYEVLRRK